MSFFDDLATIDEANEAARIHFSAKYASRIYGVDESKFTIPMQGKQTFTFIIGDQVIRIARHEAANEKMIKEAVVLQVLAGNTSLQTPAILDFQPDRNIMHITRVDGVPLSLDKFKKLSARQLDSIGFKVGQFLGEAHALLPQSDHLDELEIVVQEKILNTSTVLLKDETDANKRQRLQAAAVYVESYNDFASPHVTVHGDLNPGNLMYDESTDRLGIIDFNATRIAPRHFDFIAPYQWPVGTPYDKALIAYKETTGIMIDPEQVSHATDAITLYRDSLLFRYPRSVVGKNILSATDEDVALIRPPQLYSADGPKNDKP